MKTIYLLLILLSPSLQAACKCNCNPLDISLCAGNYALDHQCGNVCAPSAGVVAPLVTACSLVEVTNPILGTKVWVNTCPE